LQRERQHVALAAIAEQTKIKQSLLEGLERDDVSHWPTGIFRRAFIRAYSQAIGLEPDPVVREFVELYPDSVEVISTVSSAPLDAGGERVNRPPPTRLRCVLESAIAALARFRRPAVTEPVVAAVGVTATDRHPPVEPQPVIPQLDLTAAAHLCTKLSQAMETREVAPLLEHAASLLDAVGLVVWVWDPAETALAPILAHGYSDLVLAQLPRVGRDADNAIAAAFRSAEMRIVNGSDLATGAVVAPLMAPRRCAGVLALELRGRGEQRESVRAMATILAAQLATLVGSVPLAEAVNA
jgi:hypothetical protein